MRIVLDSNLYVSALLLPNRIPDQLLQAAYRKQLLVSHAQLEELDKVLKREKFRRYFSDNEVALFQTKLLAKAQLIQVSSIISDCRDPKDNHILALALDGKADLVVTGDKDLLVLHPWRGIPLLEPGAALQRLA